jgi:hypothetical protein
MEIETFATVNKKKDKKIKQNNTYGKKGSVGKTFSERSFGGNMSNRKYTKENVKKHKLVQNNTPPITNKIKKDVIPPLYPTNVDNLPSSSKTYRTGYLNTKNYIEQPKELDKYYEPSQQLDNINLKQPSINIKNIVNDKNVNTQDTAVGNGNGNGYGYDYGYGNYNNGWNWLYGGYYNPFLAFNPYAPYSYFSPLIDNDDNTPDYSNQINNLNMKIQHFSMITSLLAFFLIIMILFIFIKK